MSSTTPHNPICPQSYSVTAVPEMCVLYLAGVGWRWEGGKGGRRLLLICNGSSQTWVSKIPGTYLKRNREHGGCWKRRLALVCTLKSEPPHAAASTSHYVPLPGLFCPLLPLLLPYLVLVLSWWDLHRKEALLAMATDCSVCHQCPFCENRSSFRCCKERQVYLNGEERNQSGEKVRGGRSSSTDIFQSLFSPFQTFLIFGQYTTKRGGITVEIHRWPLGLCRGQ